MNRHHMTDRLQLFNLPQRELMRNELPSNITWAGLKYRRFGADFLYRREMPESVSVYMNGDKGNVPEERRSTPECGDSDVLDLILRLYTYLSTRRNATGLMLDSMASLTHALSRKESKSQTSPPARRSVSQMVAEWKRVLFYSHTTDRCSPPVKCNPATTDPPHLPLENSA